MSSTTAPRVLVRVRCLNATERASDLPKCLSLNSSSSLAFSAPSDSSSSPLGANTSSASEWTFDRVFGEDSTQDAVFDEVRPLVQSCLEGYSASLLAYGQTGSGKTHTLIGKMDEPSLRGILPRAVQHLAEEIQRQSGEGASFSVTLECLEIYCERLRDLLLQPGPHSNNACGAFPGPGALDDGGLSIKQEPGSGAVSVEGATRVAVCGEAQLVRTMERGIANRTVTATAMNAESSRSHLVVTLRVTRTLPDGTVSRGKLSIADLAGSERQDRTLAVGQTVKEGNMINKSLSALGNVIHALTAPTPGFVPYRDSKLTRLLQDSLGGGAATVLIIACSPAGSNAAETLSSLRFGARARGIRNKPCTANVSVNAEGAWRAQLEVAREEVERLKEALAVVEAARGVGTPFLQPADVPQGREEKNSADSNRGSEDWIMVSLDVRRMLKGIVVVKGAAMVAALVALATC